MRENKMKQVAELLGTEIGGQFMIKGRQGTVYELRKDGVYILDCQGRGVNSAQTLLDLLRGETEIVNLPWKPESGKGYYTLVFNGDPRDGAIYTRWDNDGVDKKRYEGGLVFKTKEETKEMVEKIASFVRRERGLE